MRACPRSGDCAEPPEGGTGLVGEYGYVGAGAVVVDLVAGEGGQVVEQAAEAA